MTHDMPRDGVLLINFGEPQVPELTEVVPFLERVFLANAGLEGTGSVDAARRRSRELAQRRAPGLIEEYERIGGSPLNRQARAQASALEAELVRRGRPAHIGSGMQFTDPTIEDAVGHLRDLGVSRLAVVPVYPLCGPSTTVASLESVEAALGALDWKPRVAEVTGWHRHPAYVRLRARSILRSARAAGLDLSDPAVELVFSAHGTPQHYVETGSRYVDYVEDSCARVAREAGLDAYTLGYQNHANRGVEWTQPSIQDALGSLVGIRAVVVDAVSFMHEQSETLAELDLDLREEAERMGLAFHRVPVPHDDPAFVGVLADLVEAALGGSVDGLPPTRVCRCRPAAAICFNGEPEP